MDLETAGAIEHLSERIDALETSLRAEIHGESAAVRIDLREEIRAEGAAVRAELRAEIRAEGEAIRAELRNEIRAEGEAVRTELRTEIREGLAENRRHSEVLYDNLRDDIRILAEGFASLSTKIDANQR
jgi:hypothetical protein